MIKFIKSLWWFIKDNWFKYMRIILVGLVLTVLNLVPAYIVRLLTEAVDNETLTMAAEAAAYNSGAKNSSQVPVDMTLARYVKKPSGAKPGMVIYTNQTTVFVTPKNHIK